MSPIQGPDCQVPCLCITEKKRSLMMDAVFTPEILQMMMNIRFNNNKEYMAEHREEYIAKIRTPYYRLIDLLTPTMLTIDPDMEVRPTKVLSRIFRDTRFSRDKAPYRDHHWIAFKHKGLPRKEAVMFWFEIRIDAVNWGIGFWGENRKALDLLRRRMEADPKELISLLPILRKRDFLLQGSSYQRMPPPMSLPEELRTWYPRKEIYLIKQNIQPEWVFQPGFEGRLIADFKSLAPIYRLLFGCYELSLMT
jgi:uncharacterized protein (TIGR02453 family)